MTIQNVDRSVNEQTLINVVNTVAATALFVAPDELNPLTPNQRATNEAINTARMIADAPNFEADPETTIMRALAILNSSAKELAKMNEKHGYLAAYILCRRLTHQATYMAITANKDAVRLEQQMLRSNVSSETRKFIEADDWATEFVTTEEAASAEELLLPPEELSPKERAAKQVEAAEYVYNLLKRPMDTFTSVLMQFEKDLMLYLTSNGTTDYTPRVYLHSYTSVAFGSGKETEYEEALSFDEAERLLALKAAKRIETRANDMEALAQARTKALRAL